MKTEISMFRAIGNFLHKTPWWTLLALGFATLLFLALFTTPFNVIRLSESGNTSDERRAIKREIDHAFGDTALGAAEGVIRSLRERAQDPSRVADLDEALRDIEEARKDMSNAQADIKRTVEQVTSAARDAASAAAEEAVDKAIETNRATAEKQIEVAQEKIESLTDAREAAVDAQKKAGIDDATALAAFDRRIADAKLEETVARKMLKGLDEAGEKAKASAKANLPTPTSPTPPTPPTAPKDGKTAVDKTPFKASININDGLIALNLDSDTSVSVTPAPPLPPELRADIRERVRGDARRLGIGAVLILIFIPLFMMTMIVKFLVDRSRRSQAFAEVKKQEAESANFNRQIVEARLQTLQAQVEPHFLYNTLANVQALTEVDPPLANKMVGHLIQYLRAALPKMRETTSTIGQEVDLVRAYLNILKIRMGARLDFDINIPVELNALPFPPLMLPSLVENAIKHGLEPQREGGRIDVSAVRVGDQIRMVVTDTGRGIGESPTQAGGGVGLSNIRERLQALFGDEGKLILESNAPKGAKATIEVPVSHASLMKPFAAVDSNFTGAQKSAPATNPRPQGFAASTWWVARKTHNVWIQVLTWSFVTVMVALGVTLIVGLIGIVTGLMPIQFGHTDISGLEGMALGSLLLLALFCLLALVALILVLMAYGLGVFFAFLAVAIPAIIVVSLFPALAPWALLGFGIWWFWKRSKKKKMMNIRP
jgi:Histidine kinase/Histidine kinase-, DNA gyrase B-, and HSP90-like ATPase